MARSDLVILLAEDNDQDVAMLRRAFRQAGIRTPLRVVSNGEQAISYLKGEGRYANRARHRFPDLLLLDLKMPRKNGFQVLEWLRGQPAVAALRVVVLTSSDETRDIHNAYRFGANSFLVKPVNFTDFKNTIQTMYNYWFSLAKAPQLLQGPDTIRILEPRVATTLSP